MTDEKKEIKWGAAAVLIGVLAYLFGTTTKATPQAPPPASPPLLPVLATTEVEPGVRILGPITSTPPSPQPVVFPTSPMPPLPSPILASTEIEPGVRVLGSISSVLPSPQPVVLPSPPLPSTPGNLTPEQIAASSKSVQALPITSAQLNTVTPPPPGEELVSVFVPSTGKTEVVAVTQPKALYPILEPVAIGGPTPTLQEQIRYFNDLKTTNQSAVSNLNSQITSALMLLANLNPLTDRYANISNATALLQGQLVKAQEQVSFAQSQLDILTRYS